MWTIILGIALIGVAVWGYSERLKKNDLQLKLDLEQHDRATLMGQLQQRTDDFVKVKNENMILAEKLKVCERVRDEKGRYAKK